MLMITSTVDEESDILIVYCDDGKGWKNNVNETSWRGGEMLM